MPNISFAMTVTFFSLVLSSTFAFLQLFASTGMTINSDIDRAGAIGQLDFYGFIVTEGGRAWNDFRARHFSAGSICSQHSSSNSVYPEHKSLRKKLPRTIFVSECFFIRNQFCGCDGSACRVMIRLLILSNYRIKQNGQDEMKSRHSSADAPKWSHEIAARVCRPKPQCQIDLRCSLRGPLIRRERNKLIANERFRPRS